MRQQILPRVIRLRDAPFYVGVDMNRFNRDFRPKINEIRYGNQSVGFDRLQIDAIIDDYINRSERPIDSTGEKLWGAKKHRASDQGTAYGTSINEPTVSEFNALAERVISKKRKNS